MECRDKDLTWWQDSKFGMFIHWGLYSAAQGFWNGVETKGIGEWIQCREKIPLKDYSILAKDMTLEEFDPKEYAELAQKAGMKYVVLTAKHHEGFAMYDSSYSNYNIVSMSPSQRDPAKELAYEVRKAGLKMCFYYSHVLDWEDKDALGNDWDFKEDERVFSRYFDGKCKHQLKELLTNYGEIGLIWFDMPRGITIEQGREIKQYVESIQPRCLVSGRVFIEPVVGDYNSMGDNEVPLGKIKGAWETPATLNDTWGYKRNDLNWKTSQELVELFVDLLDKGVNYLLNIGPDGKGKIPCKSKEILMQLGKWVELNKKAIYGTKASPFDCNLDGIRVTQKENYMYIFLLNSMERKRSEDINELSHAFVLSGIRNKVVKACLLGQENKPIRISQKHRNELDEHLLTLDIGESNHFYVDVIELELDGKPDVKSGIYQLEDDKIIMPAHLAQIHKGVQQTEEGFESGLDPAQVAEKGNILMDDQMCIDQNGVVSNWYDKKSEIKWEFTIYHSGRYRIKLDTRTAKYQKWVGGHKVTMKCGGEEVSQVLHGDKIKSNANSHYFDERISIIGELDIKDVGLKELTLIADHINPQDKAGLSISRVTMEKIRDV